MTRRLTALLAAGALALGLAACSSSDGVSLESGPTASAAPEVAAALDPADFAAAAKRPGTTLIDVRSAQEFADGHLPGAINMDVEDPGFAQQVAALDPAGSYALYCHSGNRSGVAKDYLVSQGFSTVYDLAGGIEAWDSEGGEIVTG